ncbi:MAG: AMP-binding protein [Hamadaea sp.]|uniref:AMP-binding protein n=1 Tax=Hamadaea sp. TaxID=2024425 RepID=UPI0017CB49C2|nr:AMP-binding protein [Hamadaea sp.]NUR71812.1 AMP-binding protein [Hamadaea sp.]NUT19240.1 AMP-binding protein [Hamadaea sp.]
MPRIFVVWKTPVVLDAIAADVAEYATLAGYVQRAARRHPDRPALRHNGRTLTWSELDSQVDSVAGGLRNLGAPDSDGRPARVAIALPNIPEFAVSFFGAMRAGLVAVPVNPGYTPRELRHVLADSGASVLIATDAVAAAVAGIGSELGSLRWAYTCSGNEDAGRALARALARDAAPNPRLPAASDLAVLLYTSGTEGAPKGAMLTHRALIANHVQLAAVEPAIMDGSDVALLGLPMFHAYGLNSGLGAVAYHGACGVLTDRFDAEESLRLIAEAGVSVVVGVPSMYTLWAASLTSAAPMSSIRIAVCGAAPLETVTARKFAAITGVDVHIGYGLTETAPVVSSTLAAPTLKTGSIGRPLPGIEVRLVSSTGDDVWYAGSPSEDEEVAGLEHESPDSPGSDPGEIVVRGDNLFSGYWPDGRGGPGEDGWWATGDVAYADGDGDLFLVDRIGELIIVNGFNVYPYEVELVLGMHPGVAESAVLGAPDPVRGQTVRAFVVRAAGSTVDEAELARHCERNLARFKCPTQISFVPELPHSAIGKVRKVVLRDV